MTIRGVVLWGVLAVSCATATPGEERAASSRPSAFDPAPSTIETLPGIESGYVATERLRIHVLKAGPSEGEPVVFIHGNVSSATFWETTMLALPDQFRGVALDLRGYGDTESKPIDPRRGLDDMAEDVWALADALQLERVHLVGHSLGGGVVYSALAMRPTAVRSVTLVAPVSPYGYGGSRDVEGTQTYPDGGPAGVNPAFVAALEAKDKGTTTPVSPRSTFRMFYVKPPFVPEREDAYIDSMLSTQVGDAFYPGTLVKSDNWPGRAPGEKGILPALSRRYFDASGIVDVEPKPPILWVRGADDRIVSDAATFDLCTLGKFGAIPDYPGEDVCPPQPMLAQTRAVLDRYSAQGGRYTEVVIPDAGHSPYIEKPSAFNDVFHPHLEEAP